MSQSILEQIVLPITEAALLGYLASAVATVHADRPTLLAIDGRSAAGKTTLADALALQVQTLGRPALRCSIDDFHPPGHKYRSRDRGYTSESYVTEGFDYATLRAMVLEPLQPGGSRRCRLALWDSFNDCAFAEEWTVAPEDAILIVDGAFLLRPDLRPFWDIAVWLQIDWETMVERATQRDVAWVGSAAVVSERYQTFWVPTHKYYEERFQPTQYVDIVIDNRSPQAPVITALSKAMTPFAK